MLNEFYKIGQVIKVSGQKIQIRVFENRNSHILVYQGQIIKNTSVGTFVKIPKGYNNIIGKIEGEYIQENNLYSNSKTPRFSSESESIDRIIEISIIGVLNDNSFIRGLVDIPLVFSDAYLLMDDEVQKVFDFSGDPTNAISIGKINDYKEEELLVNVSSLFASHIGIFGNTGSGKSNTLAKIYTELFEKFSFNPNFKRSSFIVVDFNGEYKNAFMEQKNVFNLTTRDDYGDKIPIDKSFLEDLEIWAIICEATEKTQKPFLERAIRLYKKILEENTSINQMMEELLNLYYENPDQYRSHISHLKNLLYIASSNYTYASCILDHVQYNAKLGRWATTYSGTLQWLNDLSEYCSYITNPIINTIYSKLSTDEYGYFEFAIRYRFLYESLKKYVVEEHIAPLISRFSNRTKSIKRLFIIANDRELLSLSVISLLNVNIEFKKITPLIICKYYYEKHKRKNKEDSYKSSLHIIIDEAHNVLSTMSERESQTWKDYRLETFEEIIKEGRKFGVFLTISSQRPSDISETIISQLHNYFIHRLVNNEDIRAIGKAVAFIDKTSYEMISVLPQGACIFTGISSNFPILVQVDILPENLRPRSETVDLIEMWKS